jgi:hypothetical protein
MPQWNITMSGAGSACRRETARNNTISFDYIDNESARPVGIVHAHGKVNLEWNVAVEFHA